MKTKFLSCCVGAIFLGLVASSVSASDDPFYDLHLSGALTKSINPLAPRDAWGLLHQSSVMYPTDYAYHHPQRFDYYYRSGRALLNDPAYVGALQVCLRNNGFYCGPIDGVATLELSDAIARFQKNHAQVVTGTLTIPVRRALHLP